MNDRVNIDEVARRAGVSRSTVSRVVNGSSSVSAETLEAVTRAITELNYVPNRAARSLVNRSAMAVALILPEQPEKVFGDPFFGTLISGINDRLSRSGYVLNLLMAGEPPFDKTVRYAASGAFDGALLVSQHISDEFITRLESVVPVVYGGRPKQLSDTRYYVDIDNVAGARLAVRHLIETGRRKIVMVTGTPSMPPARDRLEGYREALAAANLPEIAVVDGDFDSVRSYQVVRDLIDSGVEFDAVFAASDVMAASVIGATRVAGLRTPEDVAVVGFDDSRLAATLSPTGLTSVNQSTSGYGARIADVLIARLEGQRPERTTVLPTTLTIRGST